MYKYIVSSGNNGAVVKTALQARGWTEASEAEAHELRAHLVWKQTVLPIRSLQLLEHNSDKGAPLAIHNHLDNNREITTKPGLIRSLRSYYQSLDSAVHCSYHAYDSIPTSFIITAACEDLEYHSMVSRYQELQNGGNTKERMPAKHCKENIWLIKPAALNQGRGIEICHSLKEIKTVLLTKITNSVWVVQKYLERPLLFKGRKFDIRVWAIVTARKELFYYKFGYLRTSSSGYSTGARDNYIHLTNNCLQKWGDNYGIHEAGNTLSFAAFQAYLDREYPELRVNVEEHIVPRMKDLIIDSYLSAKKVLHGTKRRNAFELLGYDFLIDEDFRVWLLEVNTNPYLGIPNEYIQELLPVMIDDMLNIAVDPYYPPATPRKRTLNDFELLYCEPTSGRCRDGQTLNLRRAFNAPLYPFATLSQAPMYRQNCSSHASLYPDGEERQTKPVIVKDTFTTLKEILDAQLYFDVGDFSVITARIMSHLQGWELASNEQITSALQALKLLCGSPGNIALIAFGHIVTLLGFIQSGNLPVHIQSGVVEALIQGCADTRFKKDLIKQEILYIVIELVMNPRDEETLRSKHIQLLLALSRHPAKTYYIPGETRENDRIREHFISQGGLTCLYKLTKLSNSDLLRTEVRHHLSSEFNLADWDFQVSVLTKVCKAREQLDTPEVSFQTSFDSALKPSKHSKKEEVSFTTKPKHAKIHFPKCLLDYHFLQRMRNEVEEFCELRRTTIRQKQEVEARKKEEEYDEKMRAREEEDRLYEEKRLKAEQELMRRAMERKQKKLEEKKKQMQEKELGEKVDEERRQALAEKIRRQEEMRKFEKMKRKQEMEEIKRQEDERQQILEERRRQALSEWLRLKEDQDRERKFREKQRREREDAKKREELNQRRHELQVKLDERKYRRLPKTKDTPPLVGPQTLVISSYIESIDLIKQKSGTLEKLEAEMKPGKLKFDGPRTQPPTKKRRQADQFLFEVYGQVARLGGKRKKNKRTLSKLDLMGEGEDDRDIEGVGSTSHLPSL